MKRRGNYNFLSKFNYYVPGVGGIFGLLGWLLAGGLLGGVIMIIMTFTMGQDAAMDYGNLISYPVMFIPPMLYASIKSNTNSMDRKGWKLDSSNFSPVGGLSCALLAIAGTFATGFWSDGLVSLLPEMPESLKETMARLTSGNFFLNFLMVSIFAPVCEEWLCRGMVLRGLLRNSRVKPGWAIVISAAFFALIHLNPWQAIPAFLMGCLFGYVYYKTGSLKLTMLMHFANNTLSLCLGHIDSLKDMESWQDLMPQSQYLVIATACFLLTVLVALAFRKVTDIHGRGNIDPVPSLFENDEV